MENKRWLNIVVDGNKALEQYWPDIVSNYLEKIVRRFIGESQNQENYLGLVFYNANCELVDVGYDMQFINWTKDVNKFMESLSHLSFNGNDLNQSSMAEGLAHALVMYPKPCDTVTAREYYNAERHCILVAPGDPVLKRMPVCVPMIQRAQVIGQRLQACEADFLEVAQKCVPLDVSLSVITPSPVPIFGAIFNMGNNVLTLSNAPISSYSTGKLTLLLSKNFKEAHSALKEKGIAEFPSSTSVESVNAAASDTTLLRALNLQEEQVSSVASEAMIGENIHETCNPVIPEIVSTSQPCDSLELIFSKGPGQENVASSSSQIQKSPFDDILAELNSDIDIFQPNKRSKTLTPLEEDTDLFKFFELDENPSNGINDTLGKNQEVSMENQMSFDEALRGVEIELREALNAAINTSNDQTSNVELIANSSKDVNILPAEVQPPALNTGEGSSTGLFNGNALESWYNPRGLMNTSMLDSQTFPTNVSNGNFTFPTNVSNGNFTFPNVTWNSQMQLQQNSSLENSQMQQLQQNLLLENSMMQLQQSSSHTPFSMFPDYSRGSIGNYSGQPIGQHFQPYNLYPRNNMAAYNFPVFGASNWLRSIPNFPSPYLSSNLYGPSVNDLQDYMHTWEGTVAGKINSSRFTVMKAKAFRKTTAPLTLTFRWTAKMEISHFIPQKALYHTKKFAYPIDYVFFHVHRHNNVDLYKHLKSKYLGAKIDLQYQTIVLSPSEREHYFLGTVFAGDTLFIEPL